MWQLVLIISGGLSCNYPAVSQVTRTVVFPPEYERRLNEKIYCIQQPDRTVVYGSYNGEAECNAAGDAVSLRQGVRAECREIKTNESKDNE